MSWQVQEAKQKFSELVRRATEDGPQVITRHGEEVAVLLAASDYRALTDVGEDFKALLRSAPDFELLELDRSRERAPAIEL